MTRVGGCQVSSKNEEKGKGAGNMQKRAADRDWGVC